MNANNKMNEEIEKLDKDHTAACRAFLDAPDTLGDVRKARDATSAAHNAAVVAITAAFDSGSIANLDATVIALDAALHACAAAYDLKIASAAYDHAYSIPCKTSEYMLASARALNEIKGK